MKVYVVIKCWWNDMEDSHPAHEVVGVYGDKKKSDGIAWEINKQHATYADVHEEELQ